MGKIVNVSNNGTYQLPLLMFRRMKSYHLCLPARAKSADTSHEETVLFGDVTSTYS